MNNDDKTDFKQLSRLKFYCLQHFNLLQIKNLQTESKHDHRLSMLVEHLSGLISYSHLKTKG